MKKILSSGLAIGAMISLVGCGSSSSTPATVTGQFVDTYVSGLNYACSSGATGITDDMGYYTCNEGDTVEFSLGSYVLGTATASSGIVTPEDIQPDNSDAALNVAQLLQTLDTDPTDDIITIAENFTDLDDVNIPLDDANFDDLMETELEVALVTEEEAQNHLDEAELTVLLADKTFYNVGDAWLDELVFNADLTSATWTQLVGGMIGETATDTLRVEGEKLFINEEFYAVLAEETDDYLLMNNFALDGTLDGQSRLYFDQADAEAYYDSLQPETSSTTTPTTTEAALRELLAGKTLYNSNLYESWTFNSDVTSLYFVDTDAINVGPGNSGTEAVTLSGTKLIWDDGTEANLEIFDQYITMTADGYTPEDLWYNLAEMEAELGY